MIQTLCKLSRHLLPDFGVTLNVYLCAFAEFLLKQGWFEFMDTAVRKGRSVKMGIRAVLLGGNLAPRGVGIDNLESFGCAHVDRIYQ